MVVFQIVPMESVSRILTYDHRNSNMLTVNERVVPNVGSLEAITPPLQFFASQN